LIDRNPGIRFLTSSKRTFSFRKFYNPEEKTNEFKRKKADNR